MFFQYLKEHGLQDILEPVELVFPTFSTEEKVFSFLRDIVENKRKTLIYGDYDVDGITCALVMNDYLTALGSTNHDIYNYRQRTHKLDKYAMRQCIQGRYEYMLIGDTGSADMDVIKHLCDIGVKVVILDHHDSIYLYGDFPEEVAIINTTMENLIQKKDVYKYSAGALCYCVFAKFAKEYANVTLRGESAYALTSLYADSMDMSNVLNRGVYWEAMQLKREEIPVFLQHFMNDYTVFGRRYIDFWYAPRINAAFRAEKLDLINDYFFRKDTDTVGRVKCIEEIERVYTESREMVHKIADIVKVSELDNFVFCDLDCVDDIVPIQENRLYNYTGLLANILTDRYKKTAVVVCENVVCYKGSLRDKYGRGYLPAFRQFCDAGGHKPAFGFTINPLDYQRFLSALSRIDHFYSDGTRNADTLVEEHEFAVPDSLLIEEMALYNDFAGNSLPTAYVRKQLIGNMPERYNAYNYIYMWGEYRIQSAHPLDFGSQLLLKPVKRKNVTLIA